MGEIFDFSRNGSMWTGIVVALIAWYFMVRFKKFDATTLVAVLGALFGGLVLSFVVEGQPNQIVSEVLGRYSFGLLIGTAVFYLLYYLGRRTWPTQLLR